MTDNEIIEGLEAYITTFDSVYLKEALDLINRQKAEIARLQKTQDDIDNFARDLCEERVLKGKAIADFEDLQEYIRKEKSEAIREFSEKLKQQAYECDIYSRFGKEHFAKAVAVIDIERLVEEMAEGENG